jgi:hypothetical protein
MGVDLTVWLCGTILEVILLLRGWKRGILKKYPLFYAYLMCVFLQTVAASYFYALMPKLYKDFFWTAEFTTNLAGFAVIYEILRQTGHPKLGITSSSLKFLLLLFILGLGYAAFGPLTESHTSWARTIMHLGRNLQYMKGAMLATVLGLLIRYRVPLSRQLLGLTAGYSLFLGVEIISLAFIFMPGHKDSVALRRVPPIAYDVALLTWCIGLWSTQTRENCQFENKTVQQAREGCAAPSF